MFTKVYWIKKFENSATIGIMPRPRGNDWLEDEIERLKLNGVKTVVSLLEKQETYELGLEKEGIYCLNHEIDFMNFPIKDRDLPADQQAVNILIKKLTQKLDQGEKVVIHCRMGIGRSSIIAGAILMKEGTTVTEILDQISKVRELQVPDTDEQTNWLKQFER